MTLLQFGQYLISKTQPLFLLRSARSLSGSQNNINRFYHATKLINWPTEAEAITYDTHGSPETVLKLTKLPLPALSTLDNNSVAVKMLAAPINPADINQIQGVYPVKPPLPAVGGNEGVGVVVGTGNGVHNVSIGQWVIRKTSGTGTWRSHYICNGNDLQRVPENISLFSAATLSVNPATAYRMLKDFAPLKVGDTIIQNGANSAVGLCVIQLASAFGIKTVNVIRERPDFAQVEQELKALGATVVISDKTLGSYQMQTFWEENQLPKPLLGLNMVGGINATNVVRQLDKNGVLVTYGGMSREPVAVPTASLIFQNITLKGFWVTEWNRISSEGDRLEMFEQLAVLIRAGKLQGNCEARKLSDFKAAIEAARQPLRTTTPKQLFVMN